MNRMNERIKAVITAVMYVAVFYGISMLVQFIYTMWQTSMGNSAAQVRINAVNNTYALSLVSTVITFVVYVAMGKLRDEPLGKMLEREKNPLIITVMAVSLAIGMRMLVTVYYSLSLNVDFLKKSIDAANETAPLLKTDMQVIVTLVSVCIIAPLFEELLFRGIVMKEFLKIMRPWAAIVLQALIFGISHRVLFQTIFTFIVGIILGIVYYKTHSIKEAAICHSVFNISELFSKYELTLLTGSMLTAMGTVLTVMSLMYIVLAYKKEN